MIAARSVEIEFDAQGNKKSYRPVAARADVDNRAVALTGDRPGALNRHPASRIDRERGGLGERSILEPYHAIGDVADPNPRRADMTEGPDRSG